jgi:hypothetical protein
MNPTSTTVTKFTGTNPETCGTDSWKTGLYVPSPSGARDTLPVPGTWAARQARHLDTGAPEPKLAKASAALEPGHGSWVKENSNG